MTPDAASAGTHASPCVPGRGPTSRDPALDGIKGVAAIAIMTLHVAPLTYSASSSGGALSVVLTLANTAVYQYLFRFSVPAFYTISLLLLLNSTRQPAERARRRVGRIGGLLAVWTVVYWAAGWPDAAPMSENVLRFIAGLYRHGSLYFLADLLALTLIAEILMWAASRRNERWLNSAAWSGLLLSGAALGLCEVLGLRVPFWSLANFVPYVFGAVVIRNPAYRRPLGLLAVAALALELLLLLGGRLALGDLYLYGYGRPVVVFGALGLLALALGARQVQWPRPVQAVGMCSLGVYLLHPLYIQLLSGSMPGGTLVAFDGIMTHRVVLLVAVSALTGLTVALLRRTVLRGMVC